MIVSVHPEADEELIAGAVYYAQHATRKVAEDFLDEFDYAVSLLESFQVWEHRGEEEREGSRFVGSRTASSTTKLQNAFAWSL